MTALLGTAVNTAAVIIGSLIGLLLKKGIPERISSTVMHGLALCTIFIGISGALKGENTLILILSIVAGCVIGELCRIDDGVTNLGNWLQKKLSPKKAPDGTATTKNTFAQGFVSASLLFCVGSMTIVGAMQSGLTGDHTMLYTKSMLDFVSSIVFASTLGVGVLFAASFVLVYQSALTLLAVWVQPLLTDHAIAEMTCAGSVIIIAIGLNMLGLTKIKVANMLPAIFIPALLCLFM